MASLTARFSANRVIRQYTNEYYLPRAAAYEARRHDYAALGIRLANWREMLEKEWNSLSFGGIQIETRDGQHYFRLEVIFGGVDPQAVQVELYADGPGDYARQPMTRGGALPDREGGYLFTAQVPVTRPASDFTPRLIPYFPGAAVPLEIPLILWYP
jgi:glycogen phosphorylase